ncbi:MAG: hypothetical protein JWO94_2485 [Verrucomicrobiaceae bacterium]|nr:hypothetical protein [Verrucomicrobiaceae bacterium]
MGAFDLTSAGFWESDAPHVMCNPLHPAEADGLVAFMGPGAWCLVQTSGTEGRSKWVALTKEAMLISAGAVNKHLEATARDRWLVALPVHHVGGFSILARAYAASAAVVHFQSKWNAAQFAQTCASEGITLTSLVPAQVFDLVREKLQAPDCLRAIVVGGGGLSQEVGHAALALGWRVLQSFGMTEACSQIATEPLDHLYAGFDPDRLEVLPHWDVETDAEDHLIIRGASLAKGYASRDGEGRWSWQAIDAAQGLATRDRVALWNHGTRRFLRFTGRDSHALKILGELVHLGPLQAKLDALVMAAGKAVIVPLPDERKGTALVLAMTSGDMEKVRQQFNATVAPYERLDRCVKVQRIPLTDLGKVKVNELADFVAGQG